MFMKEKTISKFFNVVFVLIYLEGVSNHGKKCTTEADPIYDSLLTLFDISHSQWQKMRSTGKIRLVGTLTLKHYKTLSGEPRLSGREITPTSSTQSLMEYPVWKQKSSEQPEI